jgi:ribosomal protein L22
VQLKVRGQNLRNKMTEKQYAPTKIEKKATKADTQKSEISGATKSQEKDFAGKKKEAGAVIKEKEQNIVNTPKAKEKVKENKEEIKEKPKKKAEPKIKKTEAIVNISSVPISTKYSMALCRFVKNKKIEKAIKDLEDVLLFKKVVPMKGEIPHKKGKGIMSGRYPQTATKYFIKILKSLLANSNYNGLEEPVIIEAVANMGSRPYGRFGRVRRKRTHIRIIARDKVLISKKKSKKIKEKEK